MGRDNYGSVNVPKSLKPRIKAAAELIDWSEAQVAEAAIAYALDLAASHAGRSSECKLVRLLAAENWGCQPYPDPVSFAAEANSPAPAAPPRNVPARKGDTDRILRKAAGAAAI